MRKVTTGKCVMSAAPTRIDETALIETIRHIANSGSAVANRRHSKVI